MMDISFIASEGSVFWYCWAGYDGREEYKWIEVGKDIDSRPIRYLDYFLERVKKDIAYKKLWENFLPEKYCVKSKPPKLSFKVICVEPIEGCALFISQKLDNTTYIASLIRGGNE